jgi:type VI secretion system protein ImpF
MKGYAPSLLDRLLGDRAQPAVNGIVSRLSMEQIKDSVARDLEALLNTRIGVAPELLDGYPECRKSILSYGLIDFAGFCLSSTDDRAAICTSLKTAIEQHEPRLRGVTASLEMEQGCVNRLNFVIKPHCKSRNRPSRSISTPCCSRRRCTTRSARRRAPCAPNQNRRIAWLMFQ